MKCHLMIWFKGQPLLEYRAEESAAQAFARAVCVAGIALVRIDRNLRDDLRPFPYERLWLL